MQLFLIRHLKTESNVNGVYMGRKLDPPIVQEYIPEFVNTIEALLLPQIKGNVKVASSPALRCRQTAQLILSAMKETTEYRIEKRLWETDYGEFSGFTSAQIRKRYPDLMHDWMYHPSKIRFPCGETFIEVQKRSWDAMADLIQETQKTLVVVTHVDVIKMIISQVMGVPLDYKRHFSIDNGSVSLVEIETDKSEMRVRYLNRI